MINNMRKTRVLLTLLYLWCGLMPLAAQSVKIIKELEKNPFASAEANGFFSNSLIILTDCAANGINPHHKYNSVSKTLVFLILFIIFLLLFHTNIQKAQTSVDYSPIEAFALPTKSNKTTGNLRWYENTLCLIVKA